MVAPLIKAGFVVAAAALPFLTNLGALIEDNDAYKFPDTKLLNTELAADYSKRVVNPLWAPTAYLQGIDCLSAEYKVKSLDGNVHDFQEHQIQDQNVLAAAANSSLSYSVHVNEDGHAVLLLKAMSLPLENDKHEKMVSGTVNDIIKRDEQITALDLLAQDLLNDPNIKTIESIGFAQGSEGVYHLAEKYNIQGTNISDTGTNHSSAKLSELVVSLDVPGDIHWLQKTGENKPATEIDLGDKIKLDWSKTFTPLQTSWVEQIQSIAFKYDEANAPEGYEDNGIKLIRPETVCNNPSLQQQ